MSLFGGASLKGAGARFSSNNLSLTRPSRPAAKTEINGFMEMIGWKEG